MALVPVILQDALILFGPIDASGDFNQVKVSHKADLLECTRFGNTEHRYCAGIETFEADGSGFVQYDDASTPKAIDHSLFTDIGGAERVFTIAYDRTDGAFCWTGKSVSESYNPERTVDQLAKFDFSIKASNRFGRGRVIVPLINRTTSFISTIFPLGAMSATQKLVSSLHLTALNGTSVNALIKSNDTNNTTTPTTRVTFTSQTVVGSQAGAEVLGPITDTFWYADITFVGTSFSLAISAAIV